MSNVKYPDLCRKLIKSLKEQGELLPNIEYMPNRLVRTHEGGNYSVIQYGSPKEIFAFLEGIQFVAFANLPTNQNID